MAHDKNGKSLSEKFAAAIEGNLGRPLNAQNIGAETRNLAEKFELLWDQTQNQREEDELSRLFAESIKIIARNARQQANAQLVVAIAEAAQQMTATLVRITPDFAQNSSGLAAALREESVACANEGLKKKDPQLRVALAAAGLRLSNAARLCEPPAAPPRGRRFEV